MSKDKNFKRWEDLQRWILNGYKNGKILKKLLTEAKRYVPECIFVSYGGLYTCKTPSHVCYDCIWHFAVIMKQERVWNYPEFQEGYKFGLNPKEPYRDANPYEESSRNRSWDCGYLLGLHEKESK